MEPKLPPPEDSRRALSPPQFGTRQLLLFMVVAAIAIVAMKSLDPLVSAVLILLALAVFAHIAGNAIGTKLQRSGGDISAPPGTSSKAEEHHFAPVTRLSHHQRLGWMMRTLTALGALTGGLGGGWFLARQAGERATVANVTLAVLSCSVLGGLLGFWLSSFLQISMQAVWQAHCAADTDRIAGRNSDA